MATLVSPGVSVTITDEAVYATAGQGTVPLIVVATAGNKFQSGSTTAVAPGTTSSTAGQLQLITSQRALIQTFGTPTFYSVGGTQQYDNELNELGLFVAYQYLGIANTAYVLRADLDLSQLIPSSTPPTGSPTNGQYWLNTANTTFGIFQSTGQENPAYAWQAQTPTVITNAANLELFVMGYYTSNKITDANATFSVITGTTSQNLSINGITIPVFGASSLTPDSLNTVANKINQNQLLTSLGITALIFARTENLAPTNSVVADSYSLRIVSNNINQQITLTGSSNQVLTALNFVFTVGSVGSPNSTPTNYIAPAHTFGSAGQFAVDTISIDPIELVNKNTIWQNITTVTSNASTNWWYAVGTDDRTCPGFSWQKATPRVITGTVGFTSAATPIIQGSNVSVQVGLSGNVYTVTASSTTLSSFVNDLNVQAFQAGSGTEVVASVYTVGNLGYLRITNYYGGNTWLHSNALQNRSPDIFGTLGVNTSQTYYSSATGTNSSPVLVGANLLTSSATVVVPGSGYNIGDNVTVTSGAGFATQQTQLIVSGIQAVNWSLASGGIGFQVGDILTYGVAGVSGCVSPVILTVSATTGSPGPISAGSGITITSVGQFTISVSSPITNWVVTRAGVVITSANSESINLMWGVATLSVNPNAPGNYYQYPSNPVATNTLQAGNNALTLNLTSGYLASNTFTIDPGTGPVTIHVPVAPNNTLAGVASAITNAFVGPNTITATVNTSGNLVITNTNGTNFVVKDISGTPLNTIGILNGWSFAKIVTYQGYSPNLTVPTGLQMLAPNNIWINTTSANRGANWAFKQYINGTWTSLNTSPNTGYVPLYASDVAANAGFGAQRNVGSVYLRYNNDGVTPPIANFVAYAWSGNSWVAFNYPTSKYIYTPSITAPTGTPANGTLWYNTTLVADIMVSSGQIWQGYNVAYPATDPNGVIIDGSQPLTQSDGTPLVDYDIWLDSSAITYPTLYRYTSATSTWVLIDNTDHMSPAGIIFDDARYTANGTATGLTTQAAMVISNWVDPDAPNAQLYPQGFLLFNTRYSTNNVKKWTVNYFPQNANTIYPTNTWVTASGNQPNGAPFMGSASQRNMVVEALNSQLASNQSIRAEQNYFNLIVTPGYPECLPSMGELNTDIKNVAFIIGDTPKNLPSDGTSIQNWATNAANASFTGDLGLTYGSDPYTALYYPWGLGTNLDGSLVFVPPSGIALLTYAYNDQVAYPWFAPAGFNRGIVIGINSVGYLLSDGTYQAVELNQGQRDVLYTNLINPIAYIPNRGLVIYGQITLLGQSAAMSRVNVSRLVCYLNYNLDNIAKPFLWEQNDSQTWKAVTSTFNSFLGNLIGLRGIYDYLVVVNSTNNTPTTIALHQLWINCYVQPIDSIEFIYIPLVLQNPGTPLPTGTTA